MWYTVKSSQAIKKKQTKSNTTLRAPVQLKLKRLTILNAEKDMQELEDLTRCWRECQIVQLLWKRVGQFLNPPYDPAIPFLGIYPRVKEIHTHHQHRHRHTHTHKDLHVTCAWEILFYSSNCKQPKCPSTDDWIDKL